MEELIAKFLPEELKERRRLYEEEMEELSKYVHACFCFPFHALQLTETDTLLTSSLFSDIMFLVWNGHGEVIYIMEVKKAPSHPSRKQLLNIYQQVSEECTSQTTEPRDASQH